MTERTLREKIASIITQDNLQLLSDFDVDTALYRQDPECGDAAFVTADAVLALIDAHTAELARLREVLENEAYEFSERHEVSGFYVARRIRAALTQTDHKEGN